MSRSSSWVIEFWFHLDSHVHTFLLSLWPMLVTQLITLCLLRFGLLYKITEIILSFSLTYHIKLLSITNKQTTHFIQKTGSAGTLILWWESWISLMKSTGKNRNVRFLVQLWYICDQSKGLLWNLILGYLHLFWAI